MVSGIYELTIMDFFYFKTIVDSSSLMYIFLFYVVIYEDSLIFGYMTSVSRNCNLLFASPLVSSA